MLDVPVPEVSLQRSRIMAVIGKLVAAGDPSGEEALVESGRAEWDDAYGKNAS